MYRRVKRSSSEIAMDGIRMKRGRLGKGMFASSAIVLAAVALALAFALAPAAKAMALHFF